MTAIGIPQSSYREHLHRELRVPEGQHTHRASSVQPLDCAFWPTRRDEGIPELPPPIVNCQRCGLSIPNLSGWWCRECLKIVPALQQTRLLSMVQIARSGEYDPSWSEWIQDYSPWLLPSRLTHPITGDGAQ